MVLALLASGGHADRQQTCLPSARHLTELRSARLLACFAHLAREVTYALDAGDGPLALLLKLGLGSAFSLARSVTTLAASTVASRRRKLERVLDDILAAPTVCDLARDIQSRVRRARDHSVFKAGRIAKTYWAVVEGRPEADAGTIDLALGRRAATRGWWMCVDPAGQAATTEWRVLGRGAGRSWLELKPLTGRTHQIRVHCTARGWPLIGDAIYGSRDTPDTLHLLARHVAIPLYPKRPAVAVAVETPVPPHMHAALAGLGWPAEV